MYTHTHLLRISENAYTNASVVYITIHTLFQFGRKRSGNVHTFLFFTSIQFFFLWDQNRFNCISVTKQCKLDRTVSPCVLPSANPFLLSDWLRLTWNTDTFLHTRSEGPPKPRIDPHNRRIKNKIFYHILIQSLSNNKITVTHSKTRSQVRRGVTNISGVQGLNKFESCNATESRFWWLVLRFCSFRYKRNVFNALRRFVPFEPIGSHHTFTLQWKLKLDI